MISKGSPFGGCFSSQGSYRLPRDCAKTLAQEGITTILPMASNGDPPWIQALINRFERSV
jgi:hypothetical protein